MPLETRELGLLVRFGEPNCLSERSENGRRLTERREIDEPDAVRKLIREAGRHCQRQPGLANPRRADDRQEPGVGCEPMLDRRKLLVTRDQRCRL
jgi:hypothetical protein